MGAPDMALYSQPLETVLKALASDTKTACDG
jgi:hypothetical protein